MAQKRVRKKADVNKVKSDRYFKSSLKNVLMRGKKSILIVANCMVKKIDLHCKFE